MKKLYGFVILAPVFMLTWATDALAGNTTCPPNPGDVTVNGNIIVKNGLCTLAGTNVNGNVLVEPSGALIVTVGGDPVAGARIRGNVLCHTCASVGILGATIMGNVRIMNTDGEAPGLPSSGHDNTAGAVTIYGDVLYKNNFNRLFARGAEIGGNLKVFNNNSDFAPLVYGNTIGGNLHCKGNDVAPAPGMAANNVDGRKQNQCSEELGF